MINLIPMLKGLSVVFFSVLFQNDNCKAFKRCNGSCVVLLVLLNVQSWITDIAFIII